MVSNAAFKLISDLGGRLLTFFLFIWIARQLPPAEFGWYIYGLSAGFVIAQLADLGLQVLISREVAVQDTAARPLVAHALRLKVTLSGPVLLILLLLAATAVPAARPAFLLLGLAQLLQTFLEFGGYLFRGQQRLRAEAGYLFLARLSSTVLVGSAVFFSASINALAAAHLAALLPVILLLFRQLRREGWLLRDPVQTAAAADDLRRRLLRTALPLGLAIFASIAYTRLALLLLGPLAGETAVAYFGTALRLIEPLQLLPAAALAAVFPVFSRLWQTERRRAHRLGWMVSLLLGGAGLLLSIFLFIAAPFLVPWLFGPQFQPVIPLVQLLGLSTIPAFLNYSLTHYLIARNQQRWITLLTMGMLLLHLGLCLGLIPIWGIWAPAFSLLIAELFLLGGCLWVLRFRPTLPAAERLPHPLTV